MARMSRRPPDRGRRSPYTAFNPKIETSPLPNGFHRDGVLEDHLLHAVNSAPAIVSTPNYVGAL
jgi:hypothetical protein